MNEFLIFIFIICVGVRAIGTYDIMRTKKTDIKTVTPIDEKDISEMTYEEFSLYILNNNLLPVINYDDFEIYYIDDRYFYYECDPVSYSNEFYEVREIASMAYTEVEDLLVKDAAILSTLFECDCCGEGVVGDYIYYSWFRRVGEADV